MAEAKRRKAAGDVKPRGNKWRQYRPSRFVRWLVRHAGPNRKQRRA